MIEPLSRTFYNRIKERKGEYHEYIIYRTYKTYSNNNSIIHFQYTIPNVSRSTLQKYDTRILQYVIYEAQIIENLQIKVFKLL